MWMRVAREPIRRVGVAVISFSTMAVAPVDVEGMVAGDDAHGGEDAGAEGGSDEIGGRKRHSPRPWLSLGASVARVVCEGSWMAVQWRSPL